MKVLVLIIAHDNPIYLEMQEQWKRYMNKYDNIQCYFMKYKSNINDYISIDESTNTIYIRGKESIIPGCLDKTIKSLYYFLTNNYKFEYLLRTNLSSVWNFDNLCNFIEKTNCLISGIKLRHQFNVFKNNTSVDFISGAGILLHISVCNFLVQNRYLLNYNIIDDVAIGIILKPYIKMHHNLNRFDAYEYEHKETLIHKDMIKNYSHIRCKCEINRKHTIELMKMIIDLIYL